MQFFSRPCRRPASSFRFLFIVLSFCLLVWRVAAAPAWPVPLGSMGQMPSANYDESKAGTFILPDPLVFDDGKPVKTARGVEEAPSRGDSPASGDECVWPQSETPEAYPLQGFRYWQGSLGQVKPFASKWPSTFPLRTVRLTRICLFTFLLERTKPVPVILALNFFGNQSVTSDPGVKTATIWMGEPPVRAAGSGAIVRGIDKEFDLEKILARGYGFATVCYQDIEPDFKEGYKEAAFANCSCNRARPSPAPDEWGAIGAWAYGLSRAMDYLEKDKDVDAHRVAIMGHSRLGKTVLWAGAQDTRFAMVLASCSGRGGASPWRRNYGETLQSMSRAFPFWFCPNLFKYVDQVDKLPVDSDDLIALIAPRPVYITSRAGRSVGRPARNVYGGGGGGPRLQTA